MKIEFKKYKTDTVVKFSGYSGSIFDEKPTGKKSDIFSFTYKSIKNLKLHLRNIPDIFKIMVTLTYPLEFPLDGKKVKEHLHSFLRTLRFKFPDLKYLWVLEFQKRGAPHFHVVFDSPSIMLYKGWISRLWYRIVGSRDTKHLRAGTRCELIRKSVFSYFSDYLKKIDQKTVPTEFNNVGRFWSCSRGILKHESIFIETASEDIFYVSRIIRTLRKYYKSLCRSWGFKWRFKNAGFLFSQGSEKLLGLVKRCLDNFIPDIQAGKLALSF